MMTRMAHATDAEAARAIEREIEDRRQRGQQLDVMEYLKPLGDGGRKDVNKKFLTSTIRSVDLHNRRHEEEKRWKLRVLERKLDDRRSRSRSRSQSRERASHHRYKRRSRSRSRSRSPRQSSTRRESRRRDRSSSHSRSRNSRRRSPTPQRALVAKAAKPADDLNEREIWAAKKAEKTKQMWEKMYSMTATVMVQNAPEFSSSSESDDEDERMEKRKSAKKEKKKKKKKHKQDKKAKKKD